MTTTTIYILKLEAFNKTNVTRYCSFLHYSQTPPMAVADREGQISELVLNLEASINSASEAKLTNRREKF